MIRQKVKKTAATEQNKKKKKKKMDQLRSMKLHGQFGKDTGNKKSEKSWHWLRTFVVSITGVSFNTKKKLS